MRELTTLANYKVNEGKLDDWEKWVAVWQVPTRQSDGHVYQVKDATISFCFRVVTSYCNLNP